MSQSTPTPLPPLNAAPSLLLLLLSVFFFASDACMIEECAAMFSRRLGVDAVIMGENPRYCTLMTNYLRCLNDTAKRCRGNLKFHTLNSLLKRQVVEFNCNRFPASPYVVGDGNLAVPVTSEQPRCDFVFEEHHRGRSRYCALFGDPHLRTFNGQFQTCRTEGAWPLVDNSFFLIQVTNAAVSGRSRATVVSKITVIIKSNRGCTEQKQYEASNVDSLPLAFVDGSSYSGRPAHKSVEVLRHNQSHVEIKLRYVATKISIRREGRYLNVAVRMPEQVLHEQTELDSGQLCVSGCAMYQTLPLKETLASPQSFAQCYQSPILFDRQLAVERCRAAQVMDFFFDACVFDLLVTGDDSSVRVAVDAQNDITRLYPPYQKHYTTGRSDLSIYEHLGDDRSAWTDCVPSSTTDRTLSSSLWPLVFWALCVRLLIDGGD